MRSMQIEANELHKYFEMVRLETELKHAVRMYNKHRLMAKNSREHLKEMKERFDEQKKVCPEFVMDKVVSKEMEGINL